MWMRSPRRQSSGASCTIHRFQTRRAATHPRLRLRRSLHFPGSTVRRRSLTRLPPQRGADRSFLFFAKPIAPTNQFATSCRRSGALNSSLPSTCTAWVLSIMDYAIEARVFARWRHWQLDGCPDGRRGPASPPVSAWLSGLRQRSSRPPAWRTTKKVVPYRLPAIILGRLLV